MLLLIPSRTCFYGHNYLYLTGRFEIKETLTKEIVFIQLYFVALVVTFMPFIYFQICAVYCSLMTN